MSNLLNLPERCKGRLKQHNCSVNWPVKFVLVYYICSNPTTANLTFPYCISFRTKKLLGFSAALLFSFFSFGNTFIVTSNTDGGPGSLREAIGLAASNGTAVKDFITFNLPNTIASRTINLVSELPPLSANLVIDGSTQTGIPFGITDAKVILSYGLPAIVPGSPTFNCINAANARDIEIYGLWFRSYASMNGFTGVGIYCNNSKNIKIGLPGKGNIFTGWLTGIGHPEGFAQPYFGSDSIFIQSNIFGLLDDGNTSSYTPTPTLAFDATCRFAISFKGSTNIKIGGTLAEGNLINFSVCAISLEAPAGGLPANFNIIEGNRIGSNAAGMICTTPAYPNYECIHAENINDLQVYRNQIMGNARGAAIDLTRCNRLAIKGNMINVDVNGNQCNSNMNEGIIVNSSDKGSIGGNQPGDKNTIGFTNNLAAITITYCTGITISKNSTYCNNDRGSIMLIGFPSNVTTIPFITILSATTNTISGKALPNSTVELFMDDECALCEGKLYVSSVLADNNGDWSYTGNNTDKMVATATEPSGTTSEFSIAKINVSVSPVIKPATCGLSNGSITNLQILSGTQWHWEDEAGNIAGTDTTLRNAAPGKYRLVIEIGSHYCSYKTNFFEIKSASLPASLTPQITAASCGLNNGAITVNLNTRDYMGKWLNTSSDSVGSGTMLGNALPGDYYLKLYITADTSCNQVFGPYHLANQSGASLNTSAMKITAATCSGSNGNITGITATGATASTFTGWVDSTNKTVANGYDLLNVAPGKYRFKFKDGGGCDTIITPFFTIPDNGKINIDTAKKSVTAARCNGKGSIQNIHTSGGETYNWVNSTQPSPVGTLPDLLNADPGIYTLIVSNHYGCQKTSPAIVIPQAAFNDVSVTAATLKNAFCGKSDGSIAITAFSKDANLYQFSWVDSTSGQTAGAGKALAGLGEGTYRLFATDTNGCQKLIYSASIQAFPPPSYDYSQVQLIDDNCNLKRGEIRSLQVKGLVGPTSYLWYDEFNQPDGTSLNLANAASGTYTLKITDGGSCSIESKPFQLGNDDKPLPAPSYTDLIIPRYGDATFTAKSPAIGSYFLSSSASGTPVLKQSTDGQFTVPKVNNDTSFYIYRKSGTCTSPTAKVNVKIVDKSFFVVPNAFTPNNDGRNDWLSVKVTGLIKIDYFRIFNRFGQLVFETHNSSNGWNGYINGILQSSGVYIWIARGTDINGKTIVDKGSFILIR